VDIVADTIPPGDYIRDELEARGWGHEDLASVMGASTRHVMNLIQGKTAVTAKTAQKLADAFGDGQTAMTWMRLQMAFELALQAQEDRETQRRAMIFNKAPVREMCRRGWIAQIKDTDRLESEICGFLDIKNIEDMPSLSMSPRKSTSYDHDTASQIAWGYRARQLARHADAPKYRDSNFEDGLKELLSLAANPEDVRRVPVVLREMGVRLVIVEHLQKTKIDGVAFWLDKCSPVIAMSVRYDRIDNFWFTLMHEMIHIKHRDDSTLDVDILGEKQELPEMEVRANREAAETLVPQQKLKSFVARTKPLFYQKRIIQFAQARGVHPGIVVGQLQNQKVIDFTKQRKLLVKVRNYILDAALTDGWGNELTLS